MKKLISFLMAMLFAFAIIACEQEKAAPETQVEETTVVDTTAADTTQAEAPTPPESK